MTFRMSSGLKVMELLLLLAEDSLTESKECGRPCYVQNKAEYSCYLVNIAVIIQWIAAERTGRRKHGRKAGISVPE